MNDPFLISIRLYLDRQKLATRLRRTHGSIEYKEIGDQSSFIISEASPATIEVQFMICSAALSKLCEEIKLSGYSGESVLSVCVRAYEYVPEINLPPGLVKIIASIESAIDVDLIDMINVEPGEAPES